MKRHQSNSKWGISYLKNGVREPIFKNILDIKVSQESYLCDSRIEALLEEENAMKDIRC